MFAQRSLLSPTELDLAFAAVKEGDAKQVAPLFLALWPRVRAYCLKRLGNETSAEDAAQRALIKMFEQAPSYRTSQPALGFAFAIAYFECLTELKSSARRRVSEGSRGEEVADDGLSPESLLSDKQHQLAAGHLLGDLSLEERALLGEDPEGMKATFAAVSPAAQRKRKQRLVSRLQHAFRDLVGLSGGGE